ncbi:sensor domain-containing diguanylate cyclase [Evansella cellulosilytica]|nr:sensor domain-containing diguanylate cyclase [Evansella cellulosilytica]
MKIEFGVLIVSLGIIVLFNIINLSQWYSLLFVIPLGIYCFIIYKQKRENNIIVRSNKMLEDVNKLLENNLKDFEDVYNSLEVPIFSYTYSNKELFISKSIEKVASISQETIIDNPMEWKELVYTEDKMKVNEKMKWLEKGNNTKIQFRIKHTDDSVRWLELIATPKNDSNNNIVKIVGTIHNITRQKELEDKLRQLAYYDELTDLPNRLMIFKHVKKALARSKRQEHNLAVMFIDLDGFKNVNDTMGHDAGDTLLKDVATRLSESVREEDLTGRLGGDEFILVLEEVQNEEIEMIAKRIIENISNPFIIDGEEVNVSPSIGISMFPSDGEVFDELVQNADKAMYYAKTNGKNSYKFYTSELEEYEPPKFSLFNKIKETVAKLGSNSQR